MRAHVNYHDVQDVVHVAACHTHRSPDGANTVGGDHAWIGESRVVRTGSGSEQPRGGETAATPYEL